MTQKIKIVGVYGTIHLIVDCACIFMLTAFLVPTISQRMEWTWCVLLYNLFAFAFQLPIGTIADRIGRNAFVSAFGCVLIGLAYFLIHIPVAASIIAGIGNACFHIGGGIDVLSISGRKATLSGIYVSIGAFGVYLGAKLAVKGLAGSVAAGAVAVLTMVACAIVLLYLDRLTRRTRKSDAEEQIEALRDENDAYQAIDLHGSQRAVHWLLIIVGCLLFTVCIRSYVGTILKFTWKSDFWLGLLFILGVVCGKIMGGILGDRFGWCRVSICSLCASAVFFLGAFQIPAFGIAAVFLFNMTMPITLTALANLFPENKGFAFGMTTFALFVGVIPSIYGKGSAFFQPAFLFGIVMISAAVLSIGLMIYRREMGKGEGEGASL